MKPMKPLVIYHANCWDGFCAAWVARKALGDCDFHAAHYGTEPPDVKDRDVYIVDFSYLLPAMSRIADLSKSLVVLDHHKTAEADLRYLALGREHVKVVFDMTKSGGRLAWEYFYGESPSPWLVDYTEDRDLWRHALRHSQEVNAALRSYPLDFLLWDGLNAGGSQVWSSLIREGEAIRRHEKQLVDTHVRNAITMTIAGHEVKVVNATVLFSEIAGELAKGMPFGACYFDRKDGLRQWSLRSTSEGVDVSEIAKRFGGGGHKQAAGFELRADHHPWPSSFKAA
jgi:oligoribonuclease NrnB/cAMP/cGMP phosphodiesterase (DHH superfamily)